MLLTLLVRRWDYMSRATWTVLFLIIFGSDARSQRSAVAPVAPPTLCSRHPRGKSNSVILKSKKNNNNIIRIITVLIVIIRTITMMIKQYSCIIIFVIIIIIIIIIILRLRPCRRLPPLVSIDFQWFSLISIEFSLSFH